MGLEGFSEEKLLEMAKRRTEKRRSPLKASRNEFLKEGESDEILESVFESLVQIKREDGKKSVILSEN